MTERDEHERLLGIYLNDHLAGAIVGTNLAKRLAATGDEVLRRLAKEIEEDRQSLLTIMSTLDVPVRQYKMVAAWAAEKVGRLKLNGRLLTRSPLSHLVELEAMLLGVEGKKAGWRALRVRAATDSRLDSARLDELIGRARDQSEELERLRVDAAVNAFGGEHEAVRTPPKRGKEN